MCVCACTCVCVCICVCMCVHVGVNVNPYVCECVCICYVYVCGFFVSVVRTSGLQYQAVLFLHFFSFFLVFASFYCAIQFCILRLLLGKILIRKQRSSCYSILFLNKYCTRYIVVSSVVCSSYISVHTTCTIVLKKQKTIRLFHIIESYIIALTI